ncbi:hypothetical protein JTB14_008069 [Gonioctena quinquepunctata]|nr:hypothetical protein JTB14_008069 [Gonioctena quinquepunctata]
MVPSSGVDSGAESLWKFWKLRRYIVAVFVFFGFFTCYALRVNLSVAIVAMTELKNISSKNGTIIQEREFEWNSVVQGYVLSSFFYGYVTTQLLGGFLATKFNGKLVFGTGIGATAFLTLFTPLAAKFDVNFLIALRILEGIFEGLTYPAITDVWTKWAPPQERSRMATIALSGNYIGTVVSMPLCSLLASNFGWETIFYCFGCVGLLWSLIWMVVVAESPEKDSRISASELKYITESLGRGESKIPMRNVPWCAILTSIPVWASVCAFFAENWGVFTLLTELPKYMRGVLDFNLNTTGFISGLPYLTMAIMSVLSGQLADWLFSKKSLNRTKIRKIFTCSGFIVQGAFIMMAASFSSPLETTICLIMATGFGGTAITGFYVNILEVAPKYAAIILGFCNTIGSSPGIISPILAGYIVVDEMNSDQWRIVFYISSGIYLFSTIVFALFATSEPQPWAVDMECSKKECETSDRHLEDGHEEADVLDKY